MSSTSNPPQPRDPGNLRLDVTKLGLIVAVLSGTAALFGAWFVLPYRMEQAERKQEVFESRTEVRFKEAEKEAREQKDILIRIDENVKQLRRERSVRE